MKKKFFVFLLFLFLPSQGTMDVGRRHQASLVVVVVVVNEHDGQLSNPDVKQVASPTLYK